MATIHTHWEILHFGQLCLQPNIWHFWPNVLVSACDCHGVRWAPRWQPSRISLLFWFSHHSSVRTVIDPQWRGWQGEFVMRLWDQESGSGSGSCHQDVRNSQLRSQQRSTLGVGVRSQMNLRKEENFGTNYFPQKSSDAVQPKCIKLWSLNFKYLFPYKFILLHEAIAVQNLRLEGWTLQGWT